MRRPRGWRSCARAMLPMLVAAVRVRVITTVTPARRRRARSRSETSSTSSASRIPVTTPRVPPPSLIFGVADPGPIGSVSAFARRSWPGSITTTVPVARIGRACDRKGCDDREQRRVSPRRPHPHPHPRVREQHARDEQRRGRGDHDLGGRRVEPTASPASMHRAPSPQSPAPMRPTRMARRQATSR